MAEADPASPQNGLDLKAAFARLVDKRLLDAFGAAIADLNRIPKLNDPRRRPAIARSRAAYWRCVGNLLDAVRDQRRMLSGCYGDPRAERDPIPSDDLRYAEDLDPEKSTMTIAGVRIYHVRVGAEGSAVAVPSTAATSPPAAGRVTRTSPKQQAILPYLNKRYPDGVPESVTTGEVRKQVGDDMERDGVPVPSWDTFNRLLGRD
jgi:hypothetical protein